MYADTLIGPPGSRGRSSGGKGKERYSRQVDELDYIVPRGGYYFEVCCCKHLFLHRGARGSSSVHIRKQDAPVDLTSSCSMMTEISGILKGATNSKVRPGSRSIVLPLAVSIQTRWLRPASLLVNAFDQVENAFGRFAKGMMSPPGFSRWGWVQAKANTISREQRTAPRRQA